MFLESPNPKTILSPFLTSSKSLLQIFLQIVPRKAMVNLGLWFFLFKGTQESFWEESWGSIKNMGRSTRFRCRSQGLFILCSWAFFCANDICSSYPARWPWISCDTHGFERELWRRRPFKARSCGWKPREGGSPWICRKGGMWHSRWSEGQRPCVVLVTGFLDSTLDLEH